jgi:AcrR family transcriptional regulator
MTADRPRKGLLTAISILDAAEPLFACHGYAGTSLRNIAGAAGLQEPGIYNHFDSKQAIYTAVLSRVLDTIGTALAERLSQAHSLPDFVELPGLLVDLLAERPHAAALLQRALREEAQLPGNEVLYRWLTELFNNGLDSAHLIAGGQPVQREALAVNLLAIFNIITGYFVSQPAFDALCAGDLYSEESIARHKQLLHRVIRAMMVS